MSKLDDALEPLRRILIELGKNAIDSQIFAQFSTQFSEAVMLALVNSTLEEYARPSLSAQH
ncbi:hypothetical protein BMIN_1199 [Bifidobacterium minimum]|uniref:Uncharacterized protein n=1 Tax=Bifidobacterium minimum TaxID=1693 RepID=A0A087BT10_9BIFI|nr:hypothetical protein [Bifidobacterium minimum]KFI74160.1 hypothetical protein BMIN_1199 [Bifidobacterium minimum]